MVGTYSYVCVNKHKYISVYVLIENHNYNLVNGLWAHQTLQTICIHPVHSSNSFQSPCLQYLTCFLSKRCQCLPGFLQVLFSPFVYAVFFGINSRTLLGFSWNLSDLDYISGSRNNWKSPESCWHNYVGDLLIYEIRWSDQNRQT